MKAYAPACDQVPEFMSKGCQETNEDETERRHEERKISCKYDEANKSQKRKGKAAADTLCVWLRERLQKIEYGSGRGLFCGCHPKLGKKCFA